MALSLPSIARKIIEDVVDLFVLSITMSASYGSQRIINCCMINSSIARDPSNIKISGLPHDPYNLVITDPDVPSPSELSLREYVHWLVTDIPGSINPSQGKEILDYAPLFPDAGIHRHILILYKQKGPLGLVEPPPRSHFNSRAFLCEMDLAGPAGIVYFHSKREPMRPGLI